MTKIYIEGVEPLVTTASPQEVERIIGGTIQAGLPFAQFPLIVGSSYVYVPAIRRWESTTGGIGLS